jgi:hypothetical protein
MGKLNLEIIPQGDLNHLLIEATLRDDIVLAQQCSEGVGIIKQKLIQGEKSTNVSRWIPKEFCGSTNVLWYLRTINSENK